jgi:hypothetical protein
MKRYTSASFYLSLEHASTDPKVHPSRLQGQVYPEIKLFQLLQCNPPEN